jgi:hypothetical protein
MNLIPKCRTTQEGPFAFESKKAYVAPQSDGVCQ